MSAAADIEYVGRLDATEARALTDQIKTGVEAVWHLITRAYTERAWDVLGYTSWDDYCTREFGTTRLRLPREERQDVVSSLRESGLSLRAIESATGVSRKTVIRDLEQVVESTPPAGPEPEPVAAAQTAKHFGQCIHCNHTFPLDRLYEGGLGYECDPCVSSDLPDQELPPLPENSMDVAPEVASPIDTPAPKPVTGLDGKTYHPKPAAPKETRRKAITDQAGNAGWELRKAVERIERLAADDRFDPQIEKVASQLRGHLIDAINSCQAVLDRINTSNKESTSER